MPNPFDPIPPIFEGDEPSASKMNALIALVNRNRVSVDEQTIHAEYQDGGVLLSAIPQLTTFHARTTSAFAAAADDDHMAAGTVMIRAWDPVAQVKADTGITLPAWNDDTSSTGAIASGVKVHVQLIDAAWVIEWVQCTP